MKAEEKDHDDIELLEWRTSMDQHKSSMGRKTLKVSLIWRRLSVEHLKKIIFHVVIFSYAIDNQPASAVNPKKAIGAQQVKFVNTCEMITLVINQLLKIHVIKLTIPVKPFY